MKNSQIENLLKDEADTIEVKRSDRVFSVPLQEKSAAQEKKVHSRSPKFKIAISTFAVCAVAIVCLMVGLFVPQNSVSASNLTSYIVEINPSFCITANNKNEVIAVCALNSDADKVVSNSVFDDLSEMTLDECFEKLIDITFEQGFFDEYPQGEGIKVFAINNENEFAKERADFARGLIEQDLQPFGLEITIAPDFMNLNEFKDKMQFEEDFSDLDKFFQELQGRRYFDPNFVPPEN